MPRIDPMKLLVCLSVLLAPNGGIRTAAEVKRLANLMAKFSKKLVSKCIYIQILKCTETDLLGQFMQTGGWALVHMWLVDGIGSKNWPLIQELLELLLCCPVDVERLKINSTPRLVKSLSTDSAHESVRLLATKLVEQWLSIVKAPKQPSSLATASLGPEMPGTNSSSSLAAISDGKSSAADQLVAVGVGGVLQEGSKNGLLGANSVAESHQKSNGYTDNSERNAKKGEDGEGEDHDHERSVDDVDAAKKTFRAIVEHQDQPVHKKTSLVLKITTKNGKQVVAKVVTPSSKKDKGDEEEEDDEDEEEVLVNIESDKQPDEAPMEQVSKDSKKLDGGDHRGSKEGSKERSSSSSSKDKDRHHRDHREKDRKSGSSSSGSRSSSSKSSSSGGGSNNNSSSSSSSKHKSSSSSSKSSSSSSSSSRDKDKERHGSSSSSTSSSSKHKSSSSSSASKSNGSSSKSGSSSSSSDKHRERSSHSTGNKDSKDSKGHSSSPNSSHNSSSGKHSAKLSRKHSKDEGNDSGSESSSNTTAGGTKSASPASGGSSTSIPSKKASISIEVRNPENRAKTVKTYNSQFRSHGLIEEAPPPPSRKGLKKPTSSAGSTVATSSASVGSTASGTAAKRSSSPPPSSGKEAVAPPEKKLKEDPPERPGSIKLIPPKRQHALVESDMFMDALSATLRKDVKKRKRRTSGSENPAPTSKPGDVAKSDGAGTTTTAKTAPASPTRTTASETAPVAGVTEATTPTTPTSPKPIVPAIAPMSFYRDTLAEEDENKDGENGKEADTEGGKVMDGQEDKRKEDDDGKERDSAATAGKEEDDEDEAIVKKPKRVRCELNDEEEDDGVEDGEKKKKKPEEGDATEDTDKTELMDVVMNDVEKKMAEEAEGGEGSAEKDDEEAPAGKKPPGPGCGPDGPPGVLVIHRRKGPKKQLRWRVADELEEIRYFELDVTERCNVTKSFTDMKQMERVDERQKFLMARKVGSEDIMVEKTPWRPLITVDNVPTSPDGSQSVERNVQHQRERGCLQALYFNKHMIPDSPVEPEPADIYQTADPVHIPLEDVTGNPDSVNDFTSMPWPDPKSTPPHESAAFNSPFFPADLPPGGGFGPGGFPPPFPPGAAGAIGNGPAPWTIHARPGVLQPGLFPLNQPPPGMAAVGGAAGGGSGGGGSPNMLSLPPPGLFPGATNFNAPPPDLALMGDVGGRRLPGAGGDRGADFRSGPPPPQQWVSSNGRPYGGGANNQRGGGPGFGNRGGGPGNWNRSAGSTGDRGRNGEEGRGNYRGHWMQNNSNRGHNNNRGGGGRKW
uniref:TFIIS N-terminal domain-containing protein n=1 Tax=Anopheles atroparvus TaxID=41427 RepID=A0AAG5DDS6_ANOAO